MIEKVYMGFEKGRKFAKNYNNRPETVTIGGKTYRFRSQGEIRLAHYFEMLKNSGHIKDWAYEQTTFVFPDSKYLVDFDILNNDGTFEYYEYKGHYQNDTRKKIILLNKYRPEVKLSLVFKSRADAKKVSSKMQGLLHRLCIYGGLTKGLIDYERGY